MGAELLEAEGDLLTDYLRQAEAASGQPIRKIMLEGPMEALTRTEVAQPALFCVSLAVTDAARARGLAARLRRRPLARRVHGRGRFRRHLRGGRDRARLAARPADGRDRRRAAGRDGRGDRPRRGQAAAPVRAGVRPPGWSRSRTSTRPTQIVVSGEEDGVVKLMELAEGAGRIARREAPGRGRLPQRADEAGAGADGGGRPRRRLVGSARPGRLELARRARRRRASRCRPRSSSRSPARSAGSSACRRWSAPARTRSSKPGPGRVLGGLVRQIHPDADVFSADSPARLDEFAAEHS